MQTTLLSPAYQLLVEDREGIEPVGPSVVEDEENDDMIDANRKLCKT